MSGGLTGFGDWLFPNGSITGSDANETPPAGRRELVTRSGRPRHGGFSETTTSNGEAPLRVSVKHPGVARWGPGVRPGSHPENSEDVQASVEAEAWKHSAAVPDQWLTFSLARIVYALAHDISPWHVSADDGGFESIEQVIAERDAADTAQLAVFLGLKPDEADRGDVAEALYGIAERREASS